MYCLQNSKMNHQTLNMPKAKCSKNTMVIGYFGIKLTSPSWTCNVKDLRTEEWPSGPAYLIVEELEARFKPMDMFSKAEQKTKVGQLKYTRKDRTLIIFVQRSKA